MYSLVLTSLTDTPNFAIIQHSFLQRKLIYLLPVNILATVLIWEVTKKADNIRRRVSNESRIVIPVPARQ